MLGVKKIWPPENMKLSRSSLSAALLAAGVPIVASEPPTFAVLGDKLQVGYESYSLIVLSEDLLTAFDVKGAVSEFDYDEPISINLLP